MTRSETITKLAAALVKAQSEMGNATKGSSNPFFKSSYADLNAIREAVLPPLNRNGIVALQPTVVVDGKNYVETTLMHESGEFLSSLTEIKVGKLNDPQAEGSGISYARRYGLQSFVNMGAKDDDGEAATNRSTTPKDAPVPTGRKAASFAKEAKKAEVPAEPTLPVAAKANGSAKVNGTTATVDGWE